MSDEERTEQEGRTEQSESESKAAEQPKTADVKPQAPETAEATVEAKPDAKKPAGETTPAAAAEKPAAADKPKVKPAPKAVAADGAPAKKAPPKKEDPPPDPRAIAAKELADQVKATIEASLGQDVVEEAAAAKYRPMLRIRKDKWPTVVALLKEHEAWRLNYLEMMAGTDYPDYLEVVIFLCSTDLKHEILLKTRTDRENAEIPSLYSVHPGVNWEEREIYDLLGITFTNHPDLRRIMMWEGFKGHPLRKDYTPWEGEEDPDVAE